MSVWSPVFCMCRLYARAVQSHTFAVSCYILRQRATSCQAHSNSRRLPPRRLKKRNRNTKYPSPPRAARIVWTASHQAHAPEAAPKRSWASVSPPFSEKTSLRRRTPTPGSTVALVGQTYAYRAPIAPAAGADRLDGCPPSQSIRDHAQTIVDAGVTTVKFGFRACSES